MIDRTRLVCERRLGTDPVDPNTSFQEGMLLHWSATGWVKSAAGNAGAIRGIAGMNKTTSPLYRAICDEEIIFDDDESIETLAHGSLLTGSIVIATAAGVLCVVTTDFTVDSLSNGTLKRVHPGSGNLTTKTVHYVSYTYQMTVEEQEQEIGLPITNSYDETFGSSQVVVFRGDCLVYTMEYDTSLAYALNAVVYDKGDGLLTSNGGGGVVAVGRVKSTPTASDPYLGVELSL